MLIGNYIIDSLQTAMMVQLIKVGGVWGASSRRPISILTCWGLFLACVDCTSIHQYHGTKADEEKNTHGNIYSETQFNTRYVTYCTARLLFPSEKEQSTQWLGGVQEQLNSLFQREADGLML